MNAFLTSNSTSMRLARTIVQAIIGVIIAYVDVVVAQIKIIPDELRPFVVAMVMAVLSPVMSELGGRTDKTEE